jgi:hypothetical protein
MIRVPAKHRSQLFPPITGGLHSGHEQFGEEPTVGELVVLGLVNGIGEPGADGRQAQHAASGVDRGVGDLLGDPADTGHDRPSLGRAGAATGPRRTR